MKSLLMAAILLPLAGCLFATGDPSVSGDAPKRMKKRRKLVPPVYDRHLYGDVTRLKLGEWAMYDDGGGLAAFRKNVKVS